MSYFMRPIRLLLIALLTGSLLTGCMPARKPLPPGPQSQPRAAYPLPAKPAKRPIPTPEDIRRLDMMLIRRVNSVPGVKSSSVAVVNTTAYVGVEKPANLSSRLTRDLKHDIPQVVKTFEPRITTVMLSFKPEIKKRISKVADDTGQGRPAAKYASDLRVIIDNSEPVR